VRRLTRNDLLRRAVGVVLFGLGASGGARPGLARAGLRRAGGGKSSLPLRRVAVRNGGRAFGGDRERFATISPRSGGGRNLASLSVSCERDLDVVFEVTSRHVAGQTVHSRTPLRLPRGTSEIPWVPAPSTQPGSYCLRIRAAGDPPGPLLGQAVVRVLDVEATFRRRSALPGERIALTVQSDAPWLRLTLLRCGPESEPTYSNSLMRGVQVGTPQRINLRGSRDRSLKVPVDLPADLASGLYCARLEGPSGHLGFAPLVIRPPAPTRRAAVVLPTTTWQTYNFYDENGDGFGGTWYALWSQRRVDLTRPHLRRGVPYRFRSYELGFQHWLASRGHTVDTYADEDIELFRSSEELRAAYDLLVFPGHTEYVTRRLYDLVQGYRDLGGRLMFLSANNFFRHVEREGDRVRLVGEWRKEGRPEGALLGAQYIANDRGGRQKPYVIAGADVAPWAFAGTGLGNGSSFGLYGVEIDAVTPSSPPGTQVLARIPDLFGPGRSAEMTYYETEQGARVFSAGALNFGGTIMLWPEVGKLLDNVWARLTAS
jgi:hypothetical protein